MSVIAKRFWVSGKVQGVFFRASARQVASPLHIQGYAKNLHDGRVEVLAVGEVSAVGRLESWLAQGPPSARVISVVSESVKLDEVVALKGFEAL
jgi:acylphosphatase